MVIRGKNYVPPIINPFDYVKLHDFHGNPLCDCKEWGCFYKNTHISAATYLKTLNLVSNLFKDIAGALDGWICKLSNLNIHEFQLRHKKGMKNCGSILTTLLISMLIIALEY